MKLPHDGKYVHLLAFGDIDQVKSLPGAKGLANLVRLDIPVVTQRVGQSIRLLHPNVGDNIDVARCARDPSGGRCNGPADQVWYAEAVQRGGEQFKRV